MSKEWKNFKCWCEGWNDAASTDTYEAYDPEMAAAMYARRDYSAEQL